MIQNRKAEWVEGPSPRGSRWSLERPVSAKVRTLAQVVFSWLPSKEAIIKTGALLPPTLRNGLVMRLLSSIAARYNELPASLTTNLGISGKLYVEIPSSKLTLLFGKPSLFFRERASLDSALALFRHTNCFIDVGSNTGLYVFYLRYRGRSSKPIYFFESDPNLFEQLEANISANRLKNTAGYQTALGSSSGKTTLVRLIPVDSSGNLPRGDWSPPILEPIEIERISFGDFVAAHGLEHICAKVDVAGAEEAFFYGARPALGKVDYLIIGILGPAIERGLPSTIIREGNFHAYYINDYKLEHSLFGEYRYVEPFHNWLFCVENPTNLRVKLKRTKFKVVDANSAPKDLHPRASEHHLLAATNRRN
jgi:FkbM family methyltransferase